MIYTDYEFYTEKYLMGRKAALDAADFPWYAQKASQMIKRYTFDNIDENEPILGPVQMCCCELAEIIFKADRAQSGAAGNVKSESVGKQSVTYVDGTDLVAYQLNVQKGIIHNWLASTGLLYCGVRRC